MSDSQEYEMDAEVEAAKSEGWTVKDRDDFQVTLQKRSLGSLKIHLVIAVLTIWWTLGLGNIFYLIYKYIWDTDQRVLTTEGEGGVNKGAEEASTISDATTESGEVEGTETSTKPTANINMGPSAEENKRDKNTVEAEATSNSENGTVELRPFAETRYNWIYRSASRVSSVPFFRWVLKITVIWYRFAIMRCLGLAQRFRPEATIIRRYQVDTVNVYEQFFAGYRGEDQPEIVRTVDGS